MRQVRTCDFCGGEAAGTFELVRPEDDPDGEGRRLVLCSDCRDTLAWVLEPLLGGAAGTEGTTGSGSGTTVVAEPDRGPGGGTDGDAPDAGPEAGPNADGTSPAGGGTGDTRGESDGAADREPDLGEAFEGGESTEGTGGGGRPPSQRRGTPRGYRKVMRFLENREFPVDREEAETLAAEAYGMDPESVSAAVDHAVKHDRLREVGGDLRQ